MSDRPPAPGVPEYLDQSGGGVPRVRPRSLVVGVGVAGALAVAGAGTWAAMALLGSGPQPAEALPAGTLAYLSVDLDPSATQKIEAVRMLKKFPALDDRLGLDTSDDLRRAIYDWVQGDAGCAGLDYGRDIEPWLGARAAVAAVDTGGDTPSPVVVLAVSDESAAEKGLARIRGCGEATTSPSGTAEGGWVVSDGWAVVAEDAAVAQEVADAAAAASLADDPTYQQWQQAVGDPGIVTVYAAPAAGTALGDLMTQAGAAEGAETGGALKDFAGMAGTLRFHDGSLQLEVVGGAGPDRLPVSDGAGAAVADLPDDTAVALGFALAEGWSDRLLEELNALDGGATTGRDWQDRLSKETGLTLPQDAETLLGDSTVVAMGPDLDLDALAGSTDGSEIPLGVTVHGDAAGIERVLGTLRTRLPAEAAGLLHSDTEGDRVAIGPNAHYRSQLLADGGLGDTRTFRAVVPEADRAGVVLFVDFDAGGSWLTRLTRDDPELSENLEPLSGLGVSGWLDGDVSHLLVSLTTD